MKSTIIKQESNPFLEREEFLIEIISESQPTKEEIVEDLGKDKNLTIIRKIHNNFGKQSFIVDILVYETEEAKEKYTVIPKKIRKKMEAEKKKAEEEEKKRLAEERAATEAAIQAEKKSKEESIESEEVKEEEAKD